MKPAASAAAAPPEDLRSCGEVPRVPRRPGERVRRLLAGHPLGAGGLADDDRTRPPQPRHGLGVPVGDVGCEVQHACRRPHACCRERILDRHGQPVERSADPTGPTLIIPLACLSERPLGIDRHDGPEVAVEGRDARPPVARRARDSSPHPRGATRAAPSRSRSSDPASGWPSGRGSRADHDSPSAARRRARPCGRPIAAHGVRAGRASRRGTPTASMSWPAAPDTPRREE